MHASAFKELVEAVRGAGDIVRLVSEYVPLKPAGGRFKGLCPFHTEKTPSFSVDAKSQLFYCFGCHAGGDIFRFVQSYEKVDFREAVELLARKWGVSVPSLRGERGPRDGLFELSHEAAVFFAARLGDPEAGARARAYVEGRGLGKETVGRLGIGYAPPGWEALRTYLLARRFKPQDMPTAGLVIARKDGRGEYDRFRDRLMFPIRDQSGRTVAFGGRSMDGSEPKYVNSPETPAYVKGNHLYGLDQAKDAIRREGCALVVEGYMDLAMLHQAGFHHAVASLGTAFTAEQARLLARFTDRVVVSYDADSAGESAAARTLDLLLEKAFQVRVVELPRGRDPDDFVREEGADAYGRRVKEAPGYLEFLLGREARSRDLSRAEEKVAAVNALLPKVSRLPSRIERATWAGRIADELQIEDELIVQELRMALKGGRTGVRQRPRAEEPLRPAEEQLVAGLLAAGEAPDPEPLGLEAKDLEGTRVAAIVGTILKLRNDGDVDYPMVLDALESEEDRKILTRIAFREAAEESGANLGACIQVLKRERLARERRDLQKEIERAADPNAVDALLLRKLELGKQIDALS